MPGFPTRPCAVRAFRRMLGGLILLLVLVLCSQCRRVAPGVTGVDLRVNGGVKADGHCVRECAKRHRGERREEQRRFVRALRGCGGVPECLGVERKRHQGKIAELTAGMQRCKRECYNEGAGAAGR